MKKKLCLAASLAVILIAASACSTSAPGTSAQSAETKTPNPVTGWELNKQGGAGRIKAAGLDVLNSEGAAEHFNAHLDIFVNGKIRYALISTRT